MSAAQTQQVRSTDIGRLGKLFGRKAGAQPNYVPDPNEQAVVISFEYGSTNLGPLSALEDEIDAAVEATGVGEFDGNEIAVDGSDGFFFMYGPSAQDILVAIRPILEETTVIRSIKAKLQYGPPTEGRCR